MLNMLTPKSRFLFTAACGVALTLVPTSGCTPEKLDAHENEQEGLPRSANWGVFMMTRHARTPDEVIERARLIGEIVLQDSDLPSPSLLDPVLVDEWAAAAANDPYREGALRFELDGHDVLVRYRPASDRLTVSTPVSTTRSPGTLAEPGAALSSSEAATAARNCLVELEQKGVLGLGEFSRDHYYVSSHRTYVESSSSAWIERYNFAYHPNLDGIPLMSAEVIVSVNANNGRCQRITVSGQVTLQRLGDAAVDVSDEATAKQMIADKITASAPIPSLEVHVDGQFGYYLPLTLQEATVLPGYIASYATQTGTPEQPLLSRRRLVALPTVAPETATLIDLLGPDW